MGYVDIVKLVFSIITGVISLFYVQFIVFAVIGLFAKKKYPKAKVQHKYGLIIPARNEEAVVGNLIKSIQKSNYPQDKLQIFVIAHNCTDKTAEICRELGATVYEYNNPNECTMGYAFRYLFDRIKDDYGIESYDGFILFNADNLVSNDYFEKLNDAFDACKGENIITSFRNTKNFGSNIMSGLYGTYFMYGCRFEMRGRTAVNCSTRVSGTGYVINSKLVKDGWKYVTLTEDWEFTADQIINGNKIKYCDDAVFYDEQPTSFKVMFRQRIRWQKGHLLVCNTRLKDLWKNLFKKGSYKMSTWDYIGNIMPFCLLYLFLWIAQFVLLCLAPVFCREATLWPIILDSMIGLGWTLLSGYLTFAVSALILFIVERKRIHNVSFIKKVGIILLFPLFMGLQFVIDVVALFSKNVGWKTIPHGDTTTVEDLQGEKVEANDTKEEK